MKRGFTLIELLVTIAIVAILVAIVVPAAKQALNTTPPPTLPVAVPIPAEQETVPPQAEALPVAPSALPAAPPKLEVGEWWELDDDNRSSHRFVRINGRLMIESKSSYTDTTFSYFPEENPTLR